jgi:glycosyltransferase involved in cell wall biosynthesis
MNQATVSVIMPVYNVDKYLSASIESVLNQTLEGVEIVCINDGSTDNSLNILQEYAEKYSNIVLIDQENTGVGIARNNGIKKATGRFISFMDPDDYYLENDTLEILYNKAIEHNVYICGGSLSEDHNDGKWIRKDFLGIYTKYTFTEEKLIKYSDYQFDFGFYRFIYDREFLLANDIFFPAHIRFQDPPFFVNAMIKAGEFYAVPNYTYCYRYGHQKLVWNEKRICDLIRGHIDNLKMSSDAGLGELHELTLHRLVNISSDCIIQGLLQESKEMMKLLYEAESVVNTDILPDDSETTSVFQVFYNYAENTEKENQDIKSLEKKQQQLRKKLKAARQELEDIKNSTSYKLGDKLLLLPKKVKKITKRGE